MRKILLTAGFTFREAVRRRALLILTVIALLIIAGFGFVINYALQKGFAAAPLIQQQAFAWGGARMLLGMLNILAAIAAIFVSSGSIGNDVENGSLHILLPRTITRAQVYLGKVLAAGVLAAGFSLLLATGVGVVMALAGPGWPQGWHFVILTFPIAPVLLAALSVWFSTRLASIAAGLVSLVFYVGAQVGSAMEAFGALSQSETLSAAGITISLISPVDAIYRWMIDRWAGLAGAVGALLRRVGGMTGISAPVPSDWMVAWAAGWLLVVILLGVWSFRTRDL